MATNVNNRRTIPVLQLDKRPLLTRRRYDFADYGFEVDAGVDALFEIAASQVNDEEGFLFFYPKDDLVSGIFSMFNLHAFLKRSGPLDQFAHSLGASVRDLKMEATEIWGRPALTYRRTIDMKDLFIDAEQVITYIGGTPELSVVDSHIYFQHRHNHYYTGMLHEPVNDCKYDSLRAQLVTAIRLVD